MPTLRALGASALLALSACATTHAPEYAGAAADAFAPVAVHIHALTHFETSAAKPAGEIILHVELKDHYGDTVKGVGRMNVQLYRPIAGGQNAPAINETQTLKWQINDFESPDDNSHLFDRATGTYRIRLDAAPWVAPQLAGSTNAYVKLRVVVTLGEHAASDEFILRK